jgi:hypothetical protein
MPIVPLGQQLQPPPGVDVVGALANAYRLKDMAAQSRYAGLREKALLKDMATQDQIAGVLKKSVDPTTGRVNAKQAAQELQLIDPERAEAWWAKASEEEKAAAAKSKAQLAQLASQAGALAAIEDDGVLVSTYARVRETMIMNKQATAEQIPDPSAFATPTDLRAYLTQQQRAMLTAEQQLDLLIKQGTARIAQKKEEREAADQTADNARADAAATETTRHNKAMEANAGANKKDQAYEKDLEEYKLYVSNHLAGQRERGFQVDNEGNVKMAGLDGIKVAYEPPKSFDEWRAGRKPAAANVDTSKADAHRNKVLPPHLRTGPPAPKHAPKPAGDTPAPKPAAAAATPKPKAPAAGAAKKEVTEAELAAIAKKRGTTVEEQRARARAAHYTIIR